MDKFDYDELERRILKKVSQLPPHPDGLGTAIDNYIIPQVVNIIVATLAEYDRMKSETQS